MRAPGERAFLARASRTWAGRLEIDEIREVTRAYGWLIPLPVLAIGSLIVSFALQSRGVNMAISVLPMLVLAVYVALAVVTNFRHLHKAQDLVALRLGLDPKAARKIDFRGYEKFERTMAQARAASGHSSRQGPSESG